jgi:DNA mismatch repair protein MutS2
VIVFPRIVSATDKRKYDDPPGLQDNGEILFNALSKWNWLLGWFLNFQWSTVAHFLGCVLALAFSVAWDQVRRRFSREKD